MSNYRISVNFKLAKFVLFILLLPTIELAFYEYCEGSRKKLCIRRCFGTYSSQLVIATNILRTISNNIELKWKVNQDVTCLYKNIKHLLILSRLAATSNRLTYKYFLQSMKDYVKCTNSSIHSSPIGLVAPNVMDSETIK